jgi:hypothetical protein
MQKHKRRVPQRRVLKRGYAVYIRYLGKWQADVLARIVGRLSNYLRPEVPTPTARGETRTLGCQAVKLRRGPVVEGCTVYC